MVLFTRDNVALLGRKLAVCLLVAYFAERCQIVHQSLVNLRVMEHVDRQGNISSRIFPMCQTGNMSSRIISICLTGNKIISSRKIPMCLTGDLFERIFPFLSADLFERIFPFLSGDLFERIFPFLSVIISGAFLCLDPVEIILGGQIEVKWAFQVKRNSNHYRVIEHVDREGNISPRIIPICLSVIISGALVYLEKIPSAGHIQVKSGFQVKRNSNHYRFPEKSLSCEIDFSREAAIKRKKEGKNKQTEEENDQRPHIIMLKNACALLNSGGGVLKIKICNRGDDFWKQLGNIWQPFEEKVTNMVKPWTYNDVCHREVGSKEILLFIKASQRLCTLYGNLYFAGDAGTYEASSEQAVNMLQNLGKKFSNEVDFPLKDLPNLPKEFTYKEKLAHHESRQIQFKDFKQEHPILESRSQKYSVKRHISAFGNTIGGEILLGVTDRSKVLGVDIKKNSQSKIEEKVNSMIKSMKFPVTPRRSVHWDIEFIPVSGDTTTTQERAVVVIKVAGMKNRGGVFIKCPESYEWLDHDTTQVIGFDQWKQRMLSGSKLEQILKICGFV